MDLLTTAWWEYCYFVHCLFKGDTIYFKFTSDANSEFFYKFTVLGSRFGRFDTGYRILNGLLRKPTVVRWIVLMFVFRVHLNLRNLCWNRLILCHQTFSFSAVLRLGSLNMCYINFRNEWMTFCLCTDCCLWVISGAVLSEWLACR